MIDPIPVYTTQPSVNKKGNRGMVIGIVVVFALLGGFIAYRQFKKTPPPKPAIVVNNQPSPTVTPAIDKSTIKIQVKNGTGTPGQAASVVDALKTAGYNADNIKTANANEYADTTTTISARTGFEGAANDIKSSLESLFTDIKIDPANLDSAGDFDIVILTGGKKYAAPTEASNPTQTPIPVDTTTPTATPTPTDTPTPTPTP